MSFNIHRIYQYRPDIQPRDVSTLVKSQLWSSTIDALNDPFEFSALRELAEYPSIQAEIKRAGITCFSRSVTNPLLWSHYAASHAGFSIGYNSAHPFFGRDQGLGSSYLLDVRYEDISPTLGFFTVDELRMFTFLTKPTCWAYEEEVRLIKSIGNELTIIPREAISEIMFGARMSQDRSKAIMSKVKESGIKVRFAQMAFLSEGYGVKPQWIIS